MIEQVLVAVLIAIVSGLVGYWRAYANKKGENLATHEDLQMLVEQVKATTEATKRIEAQISNEVWDRQRQWEMKREAVISTVQAMLSCKEQVLHSIARAQLLAGENKSPKGDKGFAELLTKFADQLNDFEAKRVVALLICSGDFGSSLLKARDALGRAMKTVYEKPLKEADDSVNAIKAPVATALALGRRELGYVPLNTTFQSNAPSATPTPDPSSPGAGS